MTYKKQKLVTSQLDWYDALPASTTTPWICTCTISTSVTWVIWKSAVTATYVRNVTGCGNMLGCCTDMNGPVPEMLSTSILVYHTAKTVFDRLEDEGIDVPEENRYFPYRATYDIEVMLQPTNKRRSKKLEWTSHHVLLSVSVCSNVPTYTEPICFLRKVIPVRRWSPVCSI